MDAITLLKDDHRRVEELFTAFEQAGARAHKTKGALVADMVRELSVHAAIEEQHFYPLVRAELPDLEGAMLEGIEEHHVVKWLLSELEHLDTGAENYDAKVSVLIESVRHHVKEEEHEVFPAVRRALGKAELGRLGERMEEAKASAPTHPHPRSPSEPPANLAVGAVAGLVDRARDAASTAVERVTHR